jgi:hypothetical protein
MAQHVHGDVLLDPRALGCAVDDLPQDLRIEPSA